MKSIFIYFLNYHFYFQSIKIDFLLFIVTAKKTRSTRAPRIVSVDTPAILVVSESIKKKRSSLTNLH